MNLFSISSFVVFFTTFSIAFLALLKGRNRRIAYIWAYLSFLVSLWGAGGFLFSTASTKETAFFWWQLTYLPVILIPCAYSQFVFSFLGVKKSFFIKFIYFLAFIFIYVDLFHRELFLGDLRYVFNEYYCPDWIKLKNPLWLFFYVGFYWILLSYCFLLLLLDYRKSSGLRKNQLRYILLGSFIGWLGPHGDFLKYFRIDIYPYTNFCIALYPPIIVFAIIRYRLMDISVAITRTGIFVAVFTFVLGLPFAIAFGLRDVLSDAMGSVWWMVPLFVSTVSAAAGPFVYLYFQRRAEDQIYHEQREYQDTLRKASLGMGRVKDLKRLVNLIVQIVTRTVKIENCKVFLFDQEKEEYVLSASKSRSSDEYDKYFYPFNSPLVQHLFEKKEPIVYDEIRQQYDTNRKDFEDLDNAFKELSAAVILPSMVENRMLAFFVLGEKKNLKLYNQDDLTVFSILANQAGLAIENAQFYEDIRKKHEQLIKAEKMATIGTMADGLSHQINNRFHAVGFISGDALDTIKLSKSKMDASDKEFFEDLEFSLGRIEDNVKRGGEIVEGLLKYTRKSEAEFSQVELSKVMDASLKMVEYKVNLSQHDITFDIPKDLPEVYGSYSQLQEVFFNLIENSCDAIKEKKDVSKDPEYKGHLSIQCEIVKDKVALTLKDNGIGIKKENLRKVFTPFFTTKLYSKKGMGLGLYIIHQIIVENHKGDLNFSSEEGVGTTIEIVLQKEKE